MFAAQLCHMPSGASTNQVKHYAKMNRHRYFGPLNPDKNGKYHNYDIGKITTPILMIHSKVDRFPNTVDVAKTYDALRSGGNTNIELLTIPGRFGVNIGDYFMSLLAPVLVYKPIFEFFDKHPLKTHIPEQKFSQFDMDAFEKFMLREKT